jgi:AAA domain
MTLPPTSSLSGVNVLLMGPSGTGKTYSIGTLVDSGLEVFFLPMESGLEALLGYYTDHGKPIPPNLHWSETIRATGSFIELLDSAKKANTLNLEALAKLSDPNRGKHNQYVKLLETLNNFVSAKDGTAFGPVNEWSSSRVLVIDGLTGLSNAALSMIVGGKPVKSQADWGMGQTYVEQILRLLCDSCQCHFILLAHVEREVDPVLGGVKLMASSLGKALAPKLPAMFSDVILTARSGTSWSWDTANPQADLKTRNLPISQTNKPDFRAIVGKWRSRGGVKTG